MVLRLITAPASYPVSLAEVQKHCSAPETDFESILEICRKAATDEAEQFTGRALIDQTWDLYLDAFPASGPVRIPKPPLIELVGVYVDGELVDAATYTVDADSDPAGQRARISLATGASWPTPAAAANAIRIRFKAGYIDDASPAVANVPFAIKAAILMIAGTLFANRETIVIGQTATLLPWAAEQLLRRYRVEKALA
jgi:uncharacterized phiE125 gp8 family phage protein